MYEKQIDICRARDFFCKNKIFFLNIFKTEITTCTECQSQLFLFLYLRSILWNLHHIPFCMLQEFIKCGQVKNICLSGCVVKRMTVDCFHTLTQIKRYFMHSILLPTCLCQILWFWRSYNCFVYTVKYVASFTCFILSLQ